MNRIVSLINRFRAAKYYKNPFYTNNKEKWNNLLREYLKYLFERIDHYVFDKVTMKDLDISNSKFFYHDECDENEFKVVEFLESFGNPKLINSDKENYVNKFYDLCLSLPKNEFGLFFMYCITMPEYIMFNRMFYQIQRFFDCLEEYTDIIRFGKKDYSEYLIKNSVSFSSESIKF